MKIYKDNKGNSYTEEDVNKLAEENQVTIDDIISDNELIEENEEENIIDAEDDSLDQLVAQHLTEQESIKPKKPSKNKKKPVVTPNNLFGEVKTFDPLGLEKFKKTPAPKPAKTVAPAGQGYKYDSRGYLVPKDTKEPSLWDDAKDFARSLFPDSEEDNNGKLTYYEQTPIKDQQALFNKDSKDAMNATGKFEFLKDYKPEDRALFVSKLVPKTNYTEKRYNSDTDSYEIAPKQEAVDYIMKDIDPSKFKTKAQLDNAIALNTKKLASQDKAFEFEQQYAKAKASPLINSKIAEIKKKYSLTTPESVAKATKELQDYAAKITTDFLINSDGFQRLNRAFASIEGEAAKNLTLQYERSKEGMLNFYDTGEKIGKVLEKQGGLTGLGGKVIQGVGRLAEGIQEGFINVGVAGMQTGLSLKQGELNDLNNFYNKYKDRADNEKFNLPETWNDLMAGAENIGQVQSLFGNNVPKTFGEARERLKKGINKINSNIESKVIKIADTKKYIDLFNKADLKDGVQLNDVFTLVGQQAPNLALTGAAAATGNPLLVGLSAANVFTQEYGSQYYDTIETGLREDLGRTPTNKEIAEAIGEGKYANRAEVAAGAAVSASLEYVSQLNILKNTGRALGLGGDAKTVLGSLFRGEIKNFSKSILQRSTGIAKSGLGEYLTESAQQAISQSVKGLQLQGDTSKYIDLREINEAGKAGGIVGAVFPFAGTIKTQTGIELRAAATKVATMFDLSNANMANLVQVNNFFNEAAKNVEERFKVGDITKEQKQVELETLGTIRSAGVKIPSEFDSKAKEKALGLMLEKANIEKAIDGKDKDLVTPELERLKSISLELSTIAISERERIRIETNKETLDKSIGSIENIVDKEGNKVYETALGSGKSVEVFENTQDAQAAYDEWFAKDIQNEKNKLQESLNNNEINQEEFDAATKKLNEETAQDISKTDGFALKNGQILINKERAAEVGALNVAPHELLHNILKSEFSDPKRKIELKDKFLSILSKSERAKLDERMKLYTAKELEDGPDEYMTQYFELLRNGTITWSDNVKETLIRLWSSVIKPIFVKQGFKNIEFEDGRDIYNFIKDYSKSIKKGKISERATELLKAGENISGVTKMSKTKSELLKDQLEELKDNEGDYDPDDFDQQVKSLKGQIERAVEKEKSETKPTVKKEISEEDTVKEIVNNEKGSISSDKVQQIYDEKGLNGADEIIKLFKPITNKIVDKRRDAPGFDRELLTDEIETGSGGILDLIRSYKSEKGVPLAAYINKQLPLRAIASSKRVLEESFSKDVTEEKGLMAAETVTEAKEKPKYKNALESKVFTPEVLESANKKILPIMRTLKSRIDAPVTLNRTVTPLIAEIRDEVGKMLDIDIKTMLGGKKDGVLRKELLRNKRYILENMTTTWLMGKDGQGGIPQAIQKQIDGKWVSYPDWVGQKIDREKTTTDQAGRTSGAELVRRLPNVANNISDDAFLAQVIGPDGNPIRGRKESLSKAMAEEGAFDIINNDFENDGPIFEAFKVNQERLGVEIAANAVVTFAAQSERGNIKQSKTYNDFTQEQKDIFNSKIPELSAGLNPYLNNLNNTDTVGRVFRNTFKDYFSKEEINGLLNDFAPWLRQIKAVSNSNALYNEDENLDLDTFIKNVASMYEDGVLGVLKMPYSHEDLFSKDNVISARTATINMFSNWVDKFGEEKAIEMMIYSGGTFKSNSALGNKKGIALVEGQIVETGKEGRKSNQITQNADDYWNNIVYASLPGGASEKNQKLLKRIQKETAAKRKKDSASGAFKDRDFKGRKEQSKKYQEIVQETFKYYFDGNNDVSDTDKAIMIVQMGSNMETAIRKAAVFTHVFVNTTNAKVGALRYEHTRPASQVAAELLAAYKKYKGNVPQEVLDSIWETYTVAVIPVAMDDQLNSAGFKSVMPPGWVKGMPTSYRYYNYATFGKDNMFAIESLDPKDKGAIIGEEFVKASKIFIEPKINATKINAIEKSFKPSKTAKGISVFDFDDTVGLTSGSVLYTMPDGSKGKLNAEEFAKEGGKMLDAGAVFDFSEFSKVVDGRPGPMVEKMKKMIGKFGPENFFILTARPANAAVPIHQFLASIDINIPLENITGLGNSTAQAKADWMTGKAAEGYNDFYFADDAIQNVKAVQDALNVLDVKSKIQQARIKFSKTISPEFNKIIEENTGMENYKVFSDIVARRRGANKNKFDFYVPPSAADFELLLYNFIGKGTRGEEQQQFFADALLKPYANGNDLMDAARQSIKKDYKALTNQFPDIKKELEKLTPDGDFTYDQAIRVAMWTEEGVEIPGISQRDQRKLTDLVNNDPELNAFKQGLIVTGRQGKGWVTPTEYWDASTIISDLHNLTEGAGRKKFLAEFIENTEEMFGKFENGKLVGPNMNKIEAVYGTNVREALEDSLYRMINGKNKSIGNDKETSRWSNWVNGSTGAIMFLNTRSAALQLLGAVNFLNFRDNNPFAAAKAFANQKQYWADFVRIWNSDKMKERRGGLKEDVAAAEIANAAAGSKNKANAVISYLLKIGYTPTQLADSFAIAMGGAPFYRNRIKSYLKEGQTQDEAEANAWSDFTKVSDETQQSGDPRDISKQQASPAGRLLLTFQNFSMQQSRIVKKSFLDLKNGRGDAKTHVAKIVYYLTIQNTLFAVLQQGLFATLFDDDDEFDEDNKDPNAKKAKIKKKTNTEKAIGVADDVLDTILRGTGFLGGIVSVLKNMYLKYRDEKEKDFKADYAKVVLEGANISPPIGSKLRKLYSGLQQTKFESDLIKERGWGVMQDGRVHLGPMYGVTGKLVEATTNVPMDRIVNKIENVSQALNSQNQAWQRVMVGVGFTPYSVGIEESKGDQEIRAKAKEGRKEAGKTKRKQSSQQERDSIANLSPEAYIDFVKKRKEAREKKRDSIANLPPAEKEAYLKKKATESEMRKREKEALKKIKADSIANLSPAEKAKYDKKVAEEKAQKKKERREKYLEKKKALQDSLAKLSPREREKYKAKKKAERHEYYMKNKKPSKPKKSKEFSAW